MNVREFPNCVHGVCKCMEGHTVDRLYVVTCS